MATLQTYAVLARFKEILQIGSDPFGKAHRIEDVALCEDYSEYTKYPFEFVEFVNSPMATRMIDALGYTEYARRELPIYRQRYRAKIFFGYYLWRARITSAEPICFDYGRDDSLDIVIKFLNGNAEEIDSLFRLTHYFNFEIIDVLDLMRTLQITVSQDHWDILDRYMDFNDGVYTMAEYSYIMNMLNY